MADSLDERAADETIRTATTAASDSVTQSKRFRSRVVDDLGDLFGESLTMNRSTSSASIVPAFTIVWRRKSSNGRQ
jgi:hypothetical protein